MNSGGGGGRKWNDGGTHSSKTAPHFGHFSSDSVTSAPQFVHVKAATLAAFPPGSWAGFAFTSFTSFESLASFGRSRVPPRARVRAWRARAVYHHMNRMTK